MCSYCALVLTIEAALKREEKGAGQWGRREKLPEIVKMTSETVMNKRYAHCLGGRHNAYLKLYPGDIISFSSKISIR